MKEYRSAAGLWAALAFGLLLTGCAGEVDRLGEQLESPDMMVRWDAIERLAETRDPEAIEPLMRALSAPEPEVHWAATDALIQFGSAAAPYLEAGLRHPNPQVQQLSAFALGEIRDVRSVPFLAEAGAYAQQPSVRIEAARALGEIGSEPAAEALAAIGQNEAEPQVLEAVRAAQVKIRQSPGAREAPMRPQAGDEPPSEDTPTAQP